jgi:DNA-binding NtrC family response regulator
MPHRILVAEDEQDMRQFLSRFLIRKGYKVDCVASGEEAWRTIDETVYDLVISDLDLGDISGLDLLEKARATDNTLPFIIITGVGTIESAVKAIQQGAFHYLTKPFKLPEIEILTQRALEFGALHRKLANMRLKEDAEDELAPMIIGQSKSIVDLLRRVEKIADSTASVIIMGETGTGKSMLARHIHMKSALKDKPFLTIDCGALTETLLESELFGHVKGAFTGAIRAKRGLLEEAQGGTIFLDEICEIPPQTQPKLLRAIQEKEMKPVGGNKSVEIEVRFISATSRDMKQMVDQGLFRQELFYRLAVVPLYLPPLRERPEDLQLLIDHFLNKFCRLYKREITQVRQDYLRALHSFSWKGNIRELANMMERSVLMAENGVLTYDCLCNELSITPMSDTETVIDLKQAVEQAEKKAIVAGMKAAGNNRSEAARLLGISRRALYDKLALYGLMTS